VNTCIFYYVILGVTIYDSDIQSKNFHLISIMWPLAMTMKVDLLTFPVWISHLRQRLLYYSGAICRL